ncbi:hypothetical protein RHSP_80331 [Rhizobium freirei PRF 81]|uniref:Uncharacterized protein n=1 Tax=Rhizobium freirei PRF 81 TaxID=363754 RepID=N6UBF3_9HYPH|nr:hypothetical protein RHSP_80331 [Rhizobium freirei PRF 81]
MGFSSGRASRAKKPRPLGFVAQARNVGLHGRCAEIVEIGLRRAFRHFGDNVLQGRENGDAILLPGHTEPDAGRQHLRRKRMQEGSKRLLKGNIMRTGNGAHCNGIDGLCRQHRKDLVRPGTGSRQKGLPKQHGLGVALLRARQRLAKFRHGCEPRRVFSGMVRFRQQNGVVPGGAVVHHGRDPVPQTSDIINQPVMNSALETAGIGKRSHRKSRRQPGHQPQQSLKIAIIGHRHVDRLHSVMGMMIVPMIMMMPLRMAAVRMIGATRRLERLADLGNRRAKPFEHGTDHMIAQNEDTLFLDLSGKMAIAEMPGKLDQMPAIPWLDLEELFVRRDDLDQLAVLSHEQIAIGKQHRLLQVEHDHLTVFEVQQLAAQMPEIMRQDNTIDGIGGWSAGWQIGGDALHGGSKLKLRGSMQNSRSPRKRECRSAALHAIHVALQFHEGRRDILFLLGGIAAPDLRQTLALVHDAIAPERLGQIKRLVGGGIDALRLAILAYVGNSGRDGNLDRATVDRDRMIGDLLLDGFDTGNAFIDITTMDNRAKLLAAETGDHVLTREDTPQYLRDRDDHGIAGCVTEAVIDRLEAIDVEDHQRGAVPGLGQRFRKGAAIEQAGKPIGTAQPFEFGTGNGKLVNRETGQYRQRTGNGTADDPGEQNAETHDLHDRQWQEIEPLQHGKHRDHDRKRHDDSCKTHLKRENINRTLLLKIADFGLQRNPLFHAIHLPLPPFQSCEIGVKALPGL